MSNSFIFCIQQGVPTSFERKVFVKMSNPNFFDKKVRQIEGENVNKISRLFSGVVTFWDFSQNSCPKLVGSSARFKILTNHLINSPIWHEIFEKQQPVFRGKFSNLGNRAKNIKQKNSEIITCAKATISSFWPNLPIKDSFDADFWHIRPRIIQFLSRYFRLSISKRHLEAFSNGKSRQMKAGDFGSH